MYSLLPDDEETTDDYLNIPPEQLVCVVAIACDDMVEGFILIVVHSSVCHFQITLCTLRRSLLSFIQD